MKDKAIVIYYSTFGSTRNVAHIISERLSCDIKEIKLVKPYSKLSAVTLGVVDSLREKMPEIKNKINIDDYNTVYIGAPIWGYTASIILKSFLKDMDFAGKMVIPFCTDDGNKGDYVEKMHELCKNADSFGECIEIQFSRKKSYEELKQEVNQIMDNAI